jgi:hypothetical protein
MTKGHISIYVEYIPDKYESTPAIVIKCKRSESVDVEYDVMCALLDASDTAILPYIIDDKRKG